MLRQALDTRAVSNDPRRVGVLQAAKGVDVDPNRRTALIAGFFFAGTFVFSIPAVLLYDPILNSADYILGEGLDARISLGALFEILLAIANIATAVVFFPVLKRVDEAVALGPRSTTHHRGGAHPHLSH